ncbi:calcium-binding protein [Mycobacterium sp. KBS0706]|uniref:calcium-binding protein n=1 Tax=Mycobacterium sp. KBS0706 TaxID=2578109 RepID=UPI00110F8F9B|nr:calcium-binding protein [Mycobacterium sp. KBS0706]TSD88550.1 calcium-binding protein [Mycobacterium sp. KBS0706]
MAIINGTPGNDHIEGTDGVDTINALGGDDEVNGNKGDDIAFLGDGNDVFGWVPGDGSDFIDGGAGLDTLDFDGANADENIQIFANAGKAIFFRDIAAVTMTLDNVETIEFEALGGSDLVTINNLAGTDVKRVAVDLAAVHDGTAGDGVEDTVVINGASAGAADVVSLSQTGTGADATVVVNGLAAQTTIEHFDAGDHLIVNGLGGNDRLDARALPQSMVLVLDGGEGNDTLIGSAGADLLLGGAGNDIVVGAKGNDTAFLGAGDDTFVWAPGEGSDTVEGGLGTDDLAFLGAGAAETVDVLANFGRATFFRDIASINMDLNDVERIQFTALGGADTVRVHDLTGTEVTRVGVDLAGTVGGATGDGAVDSVTVEGTAGLDKISLSSSGAAIGIGGLQETVSITHAEATDLLTIDAGAGDDVINAAAVAAGKISLTLSGGAGNDKLVGSAGTDTFLGGAGADRFQFNLVSDSVVGPKADRIADFSHAQGDKIDLSPIDANTVLAGNQAFSFIGTGLFTHHAGELRFAYTSPTTTTIAGDVNGDGVSDFHIALSGTIALTAADFVL